MVLFITNNPDFAQKHGKELNIEFHSASCREVIAVARDKIHLGARLLTHPLAGSIKPGDSPYRTLMLEEGGHYGVCFKSLSLIESAAAAYENAPIRAMPEDTRRDYALIDMRIIEAAIKD